MRSMSVGSPAKALEEKKTLTEDQIAFIESFREKHKFVEAKFKSGKAPQLVPKIARVIARRIGMPGAASTIGIPYQNSYGKFMGFFGQIGSKLVRFNFLLSGGDVLDSIDVYASDDVTIESTIDLMGYNITQVVDMVVDVVTGQYERYFEESNRKPSEKLLSEARARSLPNYCAAWLESNPAFLSEVKSGRFDYERHTDDFITYIQNEFGSKKQDIKASALQANVRKALEQNNLGIPAASVPAVSVKKGASKEVHFDDPSLAAIWEDAKNISPREIIDEMRESVRDLADSTSSVYSLLIYGKAGVGKDHHVEDVLREEGVRPKYVNAPVSGYTGLLLLLYQNQADQIIVFSDNDSTFADEKMVNLWKNVLDTKPVRTIGLAAYPTKIRGTNITIEDDFNFSSKVIFISNKMDFDKAILSRLQGYTYFLNFTTEEVLELIKEALNDIYAENAEITDGMRAEVFEFVQKALPAIEDIDFRAFRVALTFRLLSEKRGSDWKKRSLRHLAGIMSS